MTHKSIRSVVQWAAVAWGVAACVGPFDGDEPSWMVATILAADTTSDYAGSGSFDVTRGFTIHSIGNGDSEGQRVVFYRSREGMAPSGDYSFTRADEGGQKFTGVYFRHVEGVMEGYVVTDGRLNITSSASDRVEGSFRFTAALYCTSSLQDCNPTRLIEGAPPVELDGSFSVGPPGPMCPGSLREDGTSLC